MKEMIAQGGFIVWPLGLYSLVAVAVMLERFFYLRKVRAAEEREYAVLRSDLALGKLHDVLQQCESSKAPLAPVLRAGLYNSDGTYEQIRDAMQSALSLQVAKLQRYLSILASVGSTAPFVGLFGTVVGIIRAFEQIAARGSIGASHVAGGISEALIATAFGLLVAIPAVLAYNFFVGQVNDLSLTLANHATETGLLIARGETSRAGA
ncbi:MAG TPA: MotA/TolQ/ExbB proton channel family protein [Armatimonadota bacterium]|jgi:biopolymer transport protein ExbB/TolQ